MGRVSLVVVTINRNYVYILVEQRSKKKSKSHIKPHIEWGEKEVVVKCDLHDYFKESCVFAYHKFNSTVLLVEEYSSGTQSPLRLIRSDPNNYSVAVFAKIEGQMEPEPLKKETFYNRSPPKGRPMVFNNILESVTTFHDIVCRYPTTE